MNQLYVPNYGHTYTVLYNLKNTMTYIPLAIIFMFKAVDKNIFFVVMLTGFSKIQSPRAHPYFHSICYCKTYMHSQWIPLQNKNLKTKPTLRSSAFDDFVFWSNLNGMTSECNQRFSSRESKKRKQSMEIIVRGGLTTTWMWRENKDRSRRLT